jgi:LPS export ABC transporter protein LptC
MVKRPRRSRLARRSRLFGLTLPSAVAIIMLFTSCAMPEEGLGPGGDDGLPDVVFTDFSRDEIESGIVVFSAKASRAEYYKDEGTLIVYDVLFEDRGKDGGDAETTGQADKAVYHEDTGDAEFSGFVQVRSVDEDATFETSALKYFRATNTIEGDPGNPVIVKVGTGLFLHGTGFFADVSERAFSFRTGVRGSIRTQKEVSK